MVTTEIRWESVASFAPDEQSSPMSFGNTIELRPQGIQAINVAGIITESSDKSLHAPNTINGRPTSLIATKQYAFKSVTSDFSGNAESVMPVNIILIGATHADDVENTEVSTSGKRHPERPTAIPRSIETVSGFISFLAIFPFPVSIA